MKKYTYVLAFILVVILFTYLLMSYLSSSSQRLPESSTNAEQQVIPTQVPGGS